MTHPFQLQRVSRHYKKCDHVTRHPDAWCPEPNGCPKEAHSEEIQKEDLRRHEEENDVLLLALRETHSAGRTGALRQLPHRPWPVGSHPRSSGRKEEPMWWCDCDECCREHCTCKVPPTDDDPQEEYER